MTDTLNGWKPKMRPVEPQPDWREFAKEMQAIGEASAAKKEWAVPVVEPLKINLAAQQLQGFYPQVPYKPGQVIGDGKAKTLIMETYEEGFVEQGVKIIEQRGDHLKKDGGKPPLGLIPRSANEAEARVLAFGAKKYAPHGWREGMAWSRVLDAALRHIQAYNDGEDYDTETGELHIAHARCCLSFLIEYATYGIGDDDRFKRS